MLEFDYCNPTRLIFGKGLYKNIGAFLAPNCKNVLLHYGGGSIKKSGLYGTVIDSLKSNGINYIDFGGVQPNPSAELVYKGIELCRREKVDLILAVGGGSVIDSAKAISMGINYDNDMWDFFTKRYQPENIVPVAVILTIPAAGSEQSPDTVITKDGRKIGYTSEKIRPLLSVIAPDLFLTLPHNQMANGVCDMMSHIMERYFSNTKNTDLIDALCESTMRTIMKNAVILNKDLSNYDAWAEIGLSGSFCHNGFLSMGRITDWASHKIEHEISAAYDNVAHGAGLSVVTPSWMRYVYKDNIDRFIQFAVNVMDIDKSLTAETMVNSAIDKLAAFNKSLGLPSTMKELGIKNPDIEDMAKKCTGAYTEREYFVGNFKKLYWKDVLHILNAVI